MPRKILIVDDSAINRRMLVNTLCKDYDILEAENGQEALEVMHRAYRMLSAVLLDIVMPEVDGYEVLQRVRDNATLFQIPMIVVTGSEDEESRVRALSLGANDFITKPFNPDIVRHCVRNNISLRETASILNAIQKDKLTSLLNREAFFEKAGAMIKDREPGHYLLSCFDIDNFKLINDQYGAAEGDRILREIGRAVQTNMDGIGGLAGRISADNFAALFPVSEKDTDVLQRIQDKKLVTLEQQSIAFSIGRYLVSDTTLPASAIYDRAYLAKQSVKGRYDKHLAYFDEAMLEKLVRDQQIIGEMETALATNQFEAWFQPQYNHVTGALVGAEALARWRHPRKGIVPPGEFIPLFEQNGFVYELDKFIWREVCRYLRTWMDEGGEVLPVSVNISRYDIFRADLIETITGLVKEYDIPLGLLHLEITESAFAKSTKRIVDIVRQLVELGFTIEIDDFGSGYSSLNTLKSVPAQVVKLDMRFLEDDDDAQRGGNILESIVRMTKWLGMSIIAEGVETQEQGDFLKSIGCSHVQGFLYARPMPAADYEALCRGSRKGERLLTLETTENLNNNAFWDPTSIDTLIFNSYVGAACVYEYHNGSIELLRATDRYAHMLGGADMTVDDVLKLDLMEHLDQTTCAATLAAVREAARSKGEAAGEFLFLDLPGCPHKTYLRSLMRVIACAGDRYLVYCVSENTTAQRMAERKERQTARQLQAVMDNINCGITAVAESDGHVEYLLANDKYYELLGYTRQQYHDEAGSEAFATVCPEDRQHVLEIARHTSATGTPTSLEYRARRRDGSIVWLRSFLSVTSFEDAERPVQLCTYADVTVERQAAQDMLPLALATVMSSSPDLSFIKDKDLRYLCCSRTFAHMVGIEDEGDIVGKSDYDLFEPALADQYVADDRRLMESGESIIDMVEHIPSEDGKTRFSSTSKYLLYDSSGNVAGLYGAGRDVTQAREAESQQRFLVDNIPGGVAVYEGIWNTLESIRLTYFSDGFCKLFGYTREEYERLGRKNPTGLVAKEHLPQLVRHIEALVRDGVPLDYVYQAQAKDGSYRWIHIKAVLGERHGQNMTVNAVLLDATEQQRVLEQLRISEEESRMAIQHSGNVICRFDVATRTLRVSPNTNPIFEMQPLIADVPHGQVETGRISPETAEAYTAFYEGIVRGEKSGSATYQRKSTLGWRWLKAHSSTIFADDGTPTSAVITFADETENFERDAAYKKWVQSIQSKNPQSYSLFRCTVSAETTFDTVEGSLLSTPFEPGPFRFDEHTRLYVAECVLDEDGKGFADFLNVDALLGRYYRGERIMTLEYRERRAQGGYRWLRLTVDLVEYPHSADVEAYLLFEDIDEAKRAELLTIERAQTDPLTGVLNRTTFAERVDHLIRASKPHAQHALLMLDVDGFKLVNDTFGHGAGDQTLIDIANLLHTALRRNDLVGRLGGDEFVIFLNDIPGEAVAANKARQICELSRKTFSADVQISGSVGISLYPHDGTDFEALYKKADTTLYHVKDMGRDNFAFYHDEMGDTLPQPRPGASDTVPQASLRRERKRRMLIVDDSKIDFELMANMFSDDFVIEKARDGNAALIRLRHYGSAISVVLLDLMMPGMDGFAVLERMQQSPEMRAVPVIVVSGANGHETSLAAIRAGACDFVTKPVDADVLRIRVQSAISKAENERLRAKNSFLELQNNETTRYKTVLDRMGLAVVEMDWGKGSFVYCPTMSEHVAGTYDGRTLWHILLSDLVADAPTVKDLQQLVHDVADDRNRTDGSTTVQLKAPNAERHWYRIDVYKLANDFGLTDKLVLAFDDLGKDRTANEPTDGNGSI